MATLKTEQRSVKPLFILIIFGCTFVLALLSPFIGRWHGQVIATTIKQAKGEYQQGKVDAAIERLDRTRRFSFINHAAAMELANIYAQEGRADEAIAIYSHLPFKLAGQQLIATATHFLRYDVAKNAFHKAVEATPNAVNYSGLAYAQFNTNDISGGCKNAKTATKLGLGDKTAENAEVTCLILTGKLSEARTTYPALTGDLNGGERAIVYGLIARGATAEGQKRLEALTGKTVPDYLSLAKLHAAQGNSSKSLELVKKGMELEPANLELNQLGLSVARITHDSQAEQRFRTHLDHLTSD